MTSICSQYLTHMKKEQKLVGFTAKQIQMLKAQAKDWDVPVNQVVRQAVDAYLKRIANV